MKTIYIFVGTTAELIKVAPVIKELKSRKIKYKLVASGQNNINFQEFEWFFGKVKPDITFNYKKTDSSVFYFVVWAARTMATAIFKLDKEFDKKNRKEILLVIHGDTISSLIGAVTGKILGVKVVHIESGLRSFNYLEPFPEEISRVIISKLADIHCCPNQWASNNLSSKEGLKINTKQNTLYDIYRSAISHKVFKTLEKKVRDKYFVLIMHRQEHVLFGKEQSLDLLEFIIKNSKLKCVLINHEISKAMIKNLDVDLKKIVNLERMSYIEFIHLLKNAEFVATDGGSNQEELYYMGKPTLILRKHTERIEGLGKNALLSFLDLKKIKTFLKNYKNYEKKPLMQKEVVSKKIIDAIA